MSEPQNHEPVQRENRPFIRETVVNEKPRPSLGKKLLQTVLLAVCFGIITGIIGALIFRFTGASLLPADPISPVTVTFPRDSIPPETSAVSPPSESTDYPTPPLSPEDAQWQSVVQSMIDSHTLEMKDYQRMAVLINNLCSDTRWSLVTVSATNQEQSAFLSGHQYETQSFGVIIAITSQEVLVLTPYTSTTQFSDSSTLQVRFANLEICDAYIKARDGISDLMVMAVSRSKVTEQTLEHIQAISLGNSYVSYAGQPVVAMGAPVGGIIHSFNSGILTFIEHNYAFPDSSCSLLHTNLVGSENARGFLISLEGSLIGWIEPKYMTGGTLTAVGISDLLAYIESISNGSQGCYLGIEGITLSNDQKTLLNLEASGIYITSSLMNSPAQRAGLQTGDILTRVAGTDIRSLDELRTVLLSFTAEQTISVTVLRKGKSSYHELTYDVNIERR